MQGLESNEAEMDEMPTRNCGNCDLLIEICGHPHTNGDSAHAPYDLACSLAISQKQVHGGWRRDGFCEGHTPLPVKTKAQVIQVTQRKDIQP